MNRQKLKTALIGLDEINTVWVSKMAIPEGEKQLRAEMMNKFERQLRKLKIPPQEEDRSAKLLLMAAYGLVCKEIYMEIYSEYFSRYVYEVSGRRGISDFSRAWIADHSGEYAAYAFGADPKVTARTEVNAMCGMAQLDGYYQAGYRKKRWDSSGDGRVRDSHKAANGQIRLLEEPFVVGGSLMMFPLDTSLGAGAKEIVNCRCTMSPVR